MDHRGLGSVMSATGVVLVIALMGCSGILGLDDVTLGDAAPGDGSQAAPPNTVLGKDTRTCHQLGGDVDTTVDLTQATIQALVPDPGTGGHRTVDAITRADGTFTIEGVPDGVTYLFRHGSGYYVTDQHVIDDSFETVFRCTPPPTVAAAATPLALDLTGMTPIADNDASDRWELRSFALGRSTTNFPGVRASDTAIHAIVSWPAGSLLVDASAGDDLHVFHRRTNESSVDAVSKRTRVIASLVDWFDASGVTLQSGTQVPIAGSFQPVVTNKTLGFSTDRALFDLGYDGSSKVQGPIIRILAHPFLTTSPGSGGSTPLLTEVDVTDVSRSTSLRQSVTNHPYGDPFPATWRRYVEIAYNRIRSFKYPGTNPVIGVFAGYSQLNEYTGGAINTTPGLQPPSGAKVGGIDFTAGGLIRFDGVKPVVVTWNPVLSAKAYTLSVGRVTANGVQQFAFIATTETSIKIPAQLLNGSPFYAFILQAQRRADDYNPGKTASSGLPALVASVASGRFRLSNDCGDGAVKPGEEDCDTSGESATCNVDCTAPLCGDGLRNAAAGEICDTATDTAECDADCTLPVCGDGHVNLAVEDCDDGNTVDDGNGCSSGCKLNNVCGNGRVESIVETCDPGVAGETAACDSDCTAVQCGDGHVNTAAGEQCDNGVSNGTGSCSSTCKLQ